MSNIKITIFVALMLTGLLIADYQRSFGCSMCIITKKGKQILNIPEMFPDCKEGQAYLEKYNLVGDRVKMLGDRDVVSDDAKFNGITQYVMSNGLSFIYEDQINMIGYEWLYEKNDIEVAIRIFKFNVDFCPESSNVYDSLGEAYMENGEYNLALENYEISVKLNPNNKNGAEQIKKLHNLID